MTNIPGITVTENDELITSCNVCGASHYRRISGREDASAFEPTGLRLWNVSWTPNGVQSYTTKMCLRCIGTLYAHLGAVLEEAGPAALLNARSLVNTQETDADPEHNVSPRRTL